MPSNGTFFWRKSCGHESRWWHFLNWRGWENGGALFLGELTMVHKSPKSPIVGGIGRQCWVKDQWVFTQQPFQIQAMSF